MPGLFSSRLELVLEDSTTSGSTFCLRVIDVLRDSLGEGPTVRPHTRHHLRVEKDVRSLEDGGDLEGADARQYIIVWIVVIVVGDQLAVDLLLVPGLRHFVHDALCVGSVLLYPRGDVREVLGVLGLVMTRVPLVSGALRANLKYEDQWFVVRHIFILNLILNVTDKIKFLSITTTH